MLWRALDDRTSANSLLLFQDGHRLLEGFKGGVQVALGRGNACVSEQMLNLMKRDSTFGET